MQNQVANAAPGGTRVVIIAGGVTMAHVAKSDRDLISFMSSLKACLLTISVGLKDGHDTQTA